jgi:hypothetical protein
MILNQISSPCTVHTVPLYLTCVKLLGLRHFSSSIAGIKRYDNADTQRFCADASLEKSGVYLW